MGDLVFYIFSALTIFFGFLVVANPLSKNPVTSAMFLALTIISLAGLFVTLHAFFLAAVQILVYAGAVMVLFLFVIMLLNIEEAEKKRIHVFSWVSGGIAVLGLIYVLGSAIKASNVTEGLADATLEGSTAALGKLLFTHYLLPFEIMSVLLLVAMVGAILLSKKELK